jgi:hypothetical protein
MQRVSLIAGAIVLLAAASVAVGQDSSFYAPSAVSPSKVENSRPAEKREADNATKHKARLLCGDIKMSASRILMLTEKYPNDHKQIGKARALLVESGHELVELMDDLDRLNRCGLRKFQAGESDTNWMVIKGQRFYPDSYQASKRTIAQRMLEIDDQFSEFESAARCRTDKDCRALGAGTDGCFTRFYIPHSRLMSEEQSDTLKSLATEYTELDRRQNFLSGRRFEPIPCPAIEQFAPPMRCKVGRCAFVSQSRDLTRRQLARNSNFCVAKPAGQPGDYAFRLIFESERDKRLINRLSINDKGEIAFVLRNRGQDERRWSVIFYTYKGIQTLADAPMIFNERFMNFSYISNVSVNQQGTVAFDGWQGERHGIHTITPGSVSTMMVGSDDKYIVSTPTINNNGDIAYQVFSDSGPIGIGITDGDSFKTIDVGEEFAVYGIPAINDNGTVAFTARGKSASDPVKLFLFKDGEAAAIAADGPAADYKKIHRRIAINNLDQVAFSVEQHSGETAVLVSADGKIRTVVDESGPYALVGNVMGITDDGIVAFVAKGHEPCVGGIYTGLDPIADKVIEAGDESDEIQIASGPTTVGEHGVEGMRIGVGAVKMNNRGEFVFITDDGTKRLYLAQPINRNQDQVVQMDTNNGI